MFSALRLNSLVYILDKSNPELKKGTVVSITAPRNINNVLYGQQSNMVVDIEVSVNGGKELFKDIPANLSMADDGHIIIAENKDSMNNEIEQLYANSKLIVESCSYHEKAMQSYELMMQELNPLLAKEKEQEAKISLLENKVTGIETSLSDIKTMLSQALTK